MTAVLLVASLTPAASSAQRTPFNAFSGDFDLVVPGTSDVIAHVETSFKEATEQQHVSGGLQISWTNGNPRSGSSTRISTAQLLQALFWDGEFGDLGYGTAGRLVGVLCDYPGGTCDDFAMGFVHPANTAFDDWVGFSVPTSSRCCDGLWYQAGKGTFDLDFVGPTPDPPLLGRDGPELILGGEPFHEISFDAYNLLELWLGGQGQVARDELHSLRGHGFRVVRVMASPYWATQIEDAFFDADPAAQADKRARYFAQFDALLDAADANGIRIVASLMWQVANLGELGGHTVRVGMTDGTSLGHQRVEEYIREVVGRYAGRPTIAMWEIGNEWNLGADIQWPQFDYTSDELGAYYAETATMIHEIDPWHLVTTGDSSPRPAAMHLLQAVREGRDVDWTFDTADELAEYLVLINPEPIDVISIHYYDDAMISLGGTLGSPANLRYFKSVADQMGKPLFIGEIGCTAAVGCLDGGNAPLPMLRDTLPVLVELDLPLTLYWNYAPTVPTEAVRLIQHADRQVQ